MTVDHRVDWGKWVISTALFIPLALLLVVTARTWQAERRYEAVTQRVVHDYAAIAAWQYARRVNTLLHDATMESFSGVAAANRRTGENSPLLDATSLLQRSNSAQLAFVYYPASDRLETAGQALGQQTADSLRLVMREIARTAQPNDEPHRMLFAGADSSHLALALWVLPTPDKAPRAIYAHGVNAARLAPRFTSAIEPALLLPAVRSTATPGREDIRIRLARRDGTPVFETSQPVGETSATDTTGLAASDLHVTVDIAPRLAQALLAGGAPESQLPSLFLMVVIAGALAVAGMLHQRKSRELDALRSRFVTSVSHELRTPLAQISMFAETLSLGRERSGEEGRHFASIIFAEARRLSGIVESVLRFSRSGSDASELRRERLDLADEIRSTLETFLPIVDSRGVRLTSAVDEGLDANIDRNAFRQILINLLDNALKHGGSGGSIHVSASRQDSEILLSVDDSGPGVPHDWRERIFQPFVRMERTNVVGAGIGLSVVRDLVRAHDGTVMAESSPTGGARFSIRMPAARALHAAPVKETVEA